VSGELTGDDWMQVIVQAPAEVVDAVLGLLRERFGFRDIAPIDWCVLEREADYAHVDFAPAPPATNMYVIDWRRGEGRGNIIVPDPLPADGAPARVVNAD